VPRSDHRIPFVLEQNGVLAFPADPEPEWTDIQAMFG
jgi:hypothetical protein